MADLPVDELLGVRPDLTYQLIAITTSNPGQDDLAIGESGMQSRDQDRLPFPAARQLYGLELVPSEPWDRQENTGIVHQGVNPPIPLDYGAAIGPRSSSRRVAVESIHPKQIASSTTSG